MMDKGSVIRGAFHKTWILVLELISWFTVVPSVLLFF